jgi:hypothetical protein
VVVLKKKGKKKKNPPTGKARRVKNFFLKNCLKRKKIKKGGERLKPKIFN